jgi:hypothetical protein
MSARKQGMNSSLILWDARQPIFHVLYQFLVAHYAAVTDVIYKFDHYLEMMLLAHMYGADEVSGVGNDPSLRTRVAEGENSVVAAVSSKATVSDGNDSSSARGSGEEKFGRYLQDVCPGRVVDYFAMQDLLQIAASGVEDTASGDLGRSDEVARPSMVCFPLKPKPHELQHESWVREHWLGESSRGNT